MRWGSLRLSDPESKGLSDRDSFSRPVTEGKYLGLAKMQSVSRLIEGYFIIYNLKVTKFTI